MSLNYNKTHALSPLLSCLVLEATTNFPLLLLYVKMSYNTLEYSPSVKGEILGEQIFTNIINIHESLTTDGAMTKGLVVLEEPWLCGSPLGYARGVKQNGIRGLFCLLRASLKREFLIFPPPRKRKKGVFLRSFIDCQLPLFLKVNIKRKECLHGKTEIFAFLLKGILFPHHKSVIEGVKFYKYVIYKWNYLMEIMTVFQSPIG